MTDKNRERKCNKEEYKRKQKRKKLMKQKRLARASSRELRNYVRSKIKPYYDAFRNFKDKHILFVIKDTNNMEKILFQKNDIGRGITLLSLPVINEDMIEEYLSNWQYEETSESFSISNIGNKAINGLISFYYAVTSNEIIDTPNLIIFKNCRVIGCKDNLIPLNVRPYNLNTWYNGDATTLNGFRVYKGNKLKTFFHITENLGKTYIFYDTLLEILLYRSMMGKIRYQDLLSDHQALATRKFLSGGGLYEILATNEDEIKQRFSNEWKEEMELNLSRSEDESDEA